MEGHQRLEFYHYNRAHVVERTVEEETEELKEAMREIELSLLRKAMGLSEEGSSKAKDLLLSCLSPEQREELGKSRFVVVRGSQSGAEYAVYPYVSGNVRRIEDDQWFCITARSFFVYDTMLAVLLLIETDEEAFLRAANTQGGIWPRASNIELSWSAEFV